MKRYQKQLLVYVFLIAISSIGLGVLIHLEYDPYPVEDLEVNDFASPRPNWFAKLKELFTTPEVADTLDNEPMIVPQANAMAVIIEPLMIEKEGFEGGFGSKNLSAPHAALNTFISSTTGKLFLLITVLSTPLWLFSGYYFSRKLSWPGIYNEKQAHLKIFFISISVYIFFGILCFALEESVMSPHSALIVSNIFFLLTNVFVVHIISQLVFVFFLLSVVTFVLQKIIGSHFKQELLFWVSSIITVLLLFICVFIFISNEELAELFHLEFFGYEIASYIFFIAIIIFRIFLCRVFIRSGVIAVILYSCIYGIIIEIDFILTQFSNLLSN